MSSSYTWEPTRKAKGDAVSAPALDVTMIVVSSFLVIFAVIAQLLTTTGSSRLDTTQMVTIWLVVAGLIVLLSITYMICRAHMTVSQRDVSGEAPVTEQQPTPVSQRDVSGEAPVTEQQPTPVSQRDVSGEAPVTEQQPTPVSQRDVSGEAPVTEQQPTPVSQRDVSGEAPVTEQQLPHGIKIIQQGVPARREAQWIGILTTESGPLAHIKYDDGSEAKVPLNQVYSLN